MGVVVDTSAFVDLERSSEPFEDALEDETAVLPAIVVAELLVGVQLARNTTLAARRRARIDAITSRLPVIEFGLELAERWSELFAALRRDGAVIPANDLVVAATATSIGYDVLVGRQDEAHFSRVPGLGVRTIGGNRGRAR
ncbi:MAG: PIN domain-containing protein [Gaiellales bacterium]